MPTAAKPVSMQTAHLTAEEKQNRTEAEEALKGNDDLVYIVPSELKTKPEKELYTFLVTELKNTGILQNLDREILIQCVDSIIKMRDANKAIKKYGMVNVKADGTLSKNPACSIYKDYQTIYYQCLLQLGLSPSSRAKLALINVNTQADKDDPVKQLQKRNKERFNDGGNA